MDTNDSKCEPHTQDKGDERDKQWYIIQHKCTIINYKQIMNYKH